MVQPVRILRFHVGSLDTAFRASRIIKPRTNRPRNECPDGYVERAARLTMDPKCQIEALDQLEADLNRRTDL